MSMTTLEPDEHPTAPGEMASAEPAPGSESLSSFPTDTSSPGGATENPSEISRVGVETTGDGWSLIALVPYDGQEPPKSVTEELARSVWCAISALWHPSLLVRAHVLPRVESVDAPSPPGAREIRVIASGALDRLPSGYRTQAEDSKTDLLESGTDRAELIRQLQARLGVDGAIEVVQDEGMATTARDFLALGTARWMLGTMTVAMNHADAIDHESLARELLVGAHAWQIGDWSGAVNRLRAGFEILTQARERFYPVDAYILDLCLLDATMSAGVLADALASPIAISFIATAETVQQQALKDPQRLAALCQAIGDGWADVVGGTYSESEDSLLPLESFFWQLRHASEVYGTHLDDRHVETFARRRFGLHAQVPQIAKRFGFRFAVHMGLDAGRFPIRSESKALWESPDGSSLETLFRPPIAADRSSQGWLFPWKMAATMKNDHVAAVPLVHWPDPLAPWYLDLRRAASYSPVLGRFTTLSDFFHLTDRPYESFRPEPDAYQSPYLSQAVARRDPEPISRIARHHRLRALWEATSTLQALAQMIRSAPAGAPVDLEVSKELPPLAEIETLLECGRHAEAAQALERSRSAVAEQLREAISGSTPLTSPMTESMTHPPGYFVWNPLGRARKVAVILPDAALDLRPAGSLLAAQFTDVGVSAVVDLPPFGFAWIPKQSEPSASVPTPTNVQARGRTLKNESIEIEVDATTGGLRSIARAGEPTARLGQQLVMTGIVDAQGKPVPSLMRSERFEIEYGGPALVQATASGALIHPQDQTRLASFVERYRLWTGRPILEIEITLADLDATWLARAALADPYSVYLACRWAWPDPNSMLRRTIFLAPELTELERPESPGAIDLSTRTQRTALLFGGLPYHKKHGSRMLDTLLVAGAEVGRTFTLGVALDLEYPFHAIQDLQTPAQVVPVAGLPKSVPTSGWLAQVDHKAVVVSHVEFAREIGESHGWGIVLQLQETAGHAARSRVRLFRNPTWARQCDCLGDTIVELSIDGDSVSVDLTPHEIARIEIALA
jgi:alpha-mannosidase